LSVKVQSGDPRPAYLRLPKSKHYWVV